MAATDTIVQRAARSGLGLIPPDQGLAGLHGMMQYVNLAASATRLAAIQVDWSVLLRGPSKAPSFFDEFGAQRSGLATLTVAPTLPSSSKGPLLTCKDTVGGIEDALLEILCQVTGQGDPSPSRPFMDAGLDSLGEEHTSICRCEFQVCMDVAETALACVQGRWSFEMRPTKNLARSFQQR